MEDKLMDIPELTEKQLARAIPARTRRRLMLGHFESGDDVALLRRFVGLTQARFAEALGISVHTFETGSRIAGVPTGRRSRSSESLRVIPASFARIWSRRPSLRFRTAGHDLLGRHDTEFNPRRGGCAHHQLFALSGREGCFESPIGSTERRFTNENVR